MSSLSSSPFPDPVARETVAYLLGVLGSATAEAARCSLVIPDSDPAYRASQRARATSLLEASAGLSLLIRSILTSDSAGLPGRSIVDFL